MMVRRLQARTLRDRRAAVKTLMIALFETNMKALVSRGAARVAAHERTAPAPQEDSGAINFGRALAASRFAVSSRA